MSLTTASKITHRARCARAALHRHYDQNPSQPCPPGPQARGFRFGRLPQADPESTASRKARSNDQTGHGSGLFRSRWTSIDPRRADDMLKHMVGDFWGPASEPPAADKRAASDARAAPTSSVLAWDDSPRVFDHHYARSAYCYDYTQSPLQNLRNRRRAADENMRERQTVPPSSNDSGYIIDPITNRKVLKSNLAARTRQNQAYLDFASRTREEDDIFVSPPGKPICTSQPSGHAGRAEQDPVFHDGPPPMHELNKYKCPEIGARPWESSAQSAAPKPAPPKPATSNLPKGSLSENRERPRDHRAGAPVLDWYARRKLEKESQDSQPRNENEIWEDHLRPKPEELGKYGAVRYQEPDGRTKQKAEKEDRDSQPLNENEVWLDEPRPEPGELGKYGAVWYQESDAKPSNDSAARRRQQQQQYEDLEKYDAVRAHEPDGKYKPAQPEEPVAGLKELHKYAQAFESHEPDGKYASVNHNLPPVADAEELAGYEAFRSHEPDGLYAATAPRRSKEAIEEPKKHGTLMAKAANEGPSVLAKLVGEVYDKAREHWALDQIQVLDRLDLKRVGWTAFERAVRELYRDGVDLSLPREADQDHIELGVTMSHALRELIVREVDSWGSRSEPLESSNASFSSEKFSWSPFLKPRTVEELARDAFRPVCAELEGLWLPWPKHRFDYLRHLFQQAIKDSIMAVVVKAPCRETRGFHRPPTPQSAGGDATAKGEFPGMEGLEAYAEAEVEADHKVTGSYARDFPGDFAKTWAAKTSTQKTLLPSEMAAAKNESAIDDTLEPAMNRHVKSTLFHGRKSAVADPFSRQPQGLETAFAEECEKDGCPATKPYFKVYGHLKNHIAKNEQHVQPASSSSSSSPSSKPRASTSASAAAAAPQRAYPEPAMLNGSKTTLYKILAYDSNSQTINVAETTSLAADTSTPLTPPEVLLRLSHPARFFPHFGPLQEQGFEIVSGSGDVLVFRKVKPSSSSTTATPAATTSSRPWHHPVSPVNKSQAAAPPSSSPLSSARSAKTTLASAGAKPEAPLSPETMIDEEGEIRRQYWRELFAKAKARRDERNQKGWSDSNAGSSGSGNASNSNNNNDNHGKNNDEVLKVYMHNKPSVAKRLVVSALWMAAVAYALGVAGELSQKASSPSPPASPSSPRGGRDSSTS